ncbi:MAG: nitrate- and nitrite sensing domain-containing protein, partial [Solirubrobacterales bacterium]|nr:nitrate- and nitrite sensing domain-containing protein [Solirubrobacterales bacterium]
MTTTPPRANPIRRAARHARRLAWPLTRLRVGTKLLLLAMLPAACVVTLAAISAASDFRAAHRLSTYRAQARLSFVLESLAVELDHERRAAALVSLDPGAGSDALLDAYERATSQGFVQVRARAPHVPAPVDVVGDMEAARAQREALVRQLYARSLGPQQAIVQYSAIAQSVLGLAAALDGGAPSPTLARAATAYGALLQGIEGASRERVFVATLLAPRERQPPTADPWDGVESAELNTFRQNAAGPLVGDLESVLFSPAGLAVQRFRDQLAARPAAAVRGMPLQRWLSIAGTRMDALRAVAASAGANMDGLVSNELAAAHARAARDLAVSLAVLALITALALAVRRSITTPLREVSAAARDLARGDVARTVDYSSRDEIGDVAGAFRDVNATARRLVDEIRAGNRAVKEDRLEHRADRSGLDGVWSQLLAGTNDTMAAFGELREEQRRVADEQSALRRVATLVAAGVAPSRLFAAVAKEVANVLPGVELTVIGRYTSDRAVDFVGGWIRGTVPEWVGERFPLGGENVSTRVFETNEPARVDTLEQDTSSLGALAHHSEARSAAGAPINVEGKLWGVIVVASGRSDALPTGIEHRVAAFTELVATAIANAEAREALRAVADEQAALRRVATLVAEAEPTEKVYAAVAEEIARHQVTDVVALLRYEEDGTATVVGGWAVEDIEVPLGERLVV